MIMNPPVWTASRMLTVGTILTVVSVLADIFITPLFFGSKPSRFWIDASIAGQTAGPIVFGAMLIGGIGLIVGSFVVRAVEYSRPPVHEEPPADSEERVDHL